MGEFADMALESMMDDTDGWGPTYGWATGQPVLKRIAAARIRAHNAFDPLWKEGKMSRTAAYRWLAREMGLPREKCHMEQMSVSQCERVITLCMQKAFEDL